MAFYFEAPRDKRSEAWEALSQSVGEGLGNFVGDYYASKDLDSVLNDPALKNASSTEKIKAVEAKMRKHGARGRSFLARQMGIEEYGMKEKEQAQKTKQTQQTRESNKEIAKFLNLPEEVVDAEPGVFKEFVKQAYQEKQQNDILNNPQFASYFGQDEGFNAPPQGSDQIQQEPSAIANSSVASQPNATPKPTAEAKRFPQALIMQTAVKNKALAEQMQEHNKKLDTQENRLQDRSDKQFNADRTYHAKIADKNNETMTKLGDSVIKRKNAFALAEQALQNNELGPGSWANIASRTGIHELQTVGGAALDTASKEHLIGTTARLSAKGQNVFMEKRINDMFAKPGESNEANQARIEILKGENEMDEIELAEYRNQVDKDLAEFGYERRDALSKAQIAAEPAQQKIMKKTSYKLAEQMDREKGVTKMEESVGKRVAPGTMLTLSMASLYKEKFGDKAREVAIDNGYTIPTKEEIQEWKI